MSFTEVPKFVLRQGSKSQNSTHSLPPPLWRLHHISPSQARHSSALHSIPFAPRLVFFPIHSSRKMRHVVHGGSEVCFETRLKVAEFYPLTSSSPYAGDFEFHFYLRRDVSIVRWRVFFNAFVPIGIINFYCWVLRTNSLAISKSVSVAGIGMSSSMAIHSSYSSFCIPSGGSMKLTDGHVPAC
ncbi:hypothetical protein AVEN_208901-1 [Araneus ventricosus]|uniref:Uncharacterized protein n=1 Tax=Araneus ventricosus TaxID=182803 RepID=A0A4Y2F0V5_ARAVE|nr:hypothetical protein AVEN_208901-1 [Araneus ventricosus]